MKKHGTVLALLLLLALIIGTIGCDGEEITPSPSPVPTTTPAYTPTPVPTATSTPSSITFVAPTPTPFGITLVTPTPTPFSITMATPTPTPEPAEWQLGPTIVLVTPTPQLGEGEVIEVTPTIQVPFLYRADEFDLKVVVPNRLTLSTPDNKKAYRVDIYIKKKQDVESLGLFDLLDISVTLEVGVNVRISLLTGVSCHVFFDIDLVVFGDKCPDVICLEWPIPCLFGAGGLEAGDLGVYAFAVPVRLPEGDFSTLPLGTWNYLGSYDMYLVRPYSLDVLAAPLSGEVVRIP